MLRKRLVDLTLESEGRARFCQRRISELEEQLATALQTISELESRPPTTTHQVSNASLTIELLSDTCMLKHI